MPTKRSRVHPKYKTQYRVSNWPKYERSLVQRGDITVWFTPDAVTNWNAKPTNRRGGQRKYSDMAIEAALTLRLLLHLPLRQTEGFLISILELMDLPLDVPDHTTLSRRGTRLDLPLRSREGSGPFDLLIDSSGLAIFGEGKSAAAKHGGKGIQGWRKLHLVAEVLTDANANDASTGVALLDAVPGDIDTVIGDTAYDTRPLYAAAKRRGTKVASRRSRLQVLEVQDALREIRPFVESGRLVVAAGRRTLPTTDKAAPRMRSSDSSRSSVTGCEPVALMPSPLKPDLPAPCSTA